MTTNDERREVAHRLRDCSRFVINTHSEWLELVERAIGTWDNKATGVGCFEVDRGREPDGDMMRLADLIDPQEITEDTSDGYHTSSRRERTCHILPVKDGGYACDRCFTWFDEMKKVPRYCSHCGARVVDEFGDKTEAHSCCGDMHTRNRFRGMAFRYCPNCGAEVLGDE